MQNIRQHEIIFLHFCLIKYLIAEGAKISSEQIEFKEEAVTFSLPKSLRN